MSFLHPGFLFGLLTLSLPLLFHFLKRRRVRKAVFPTLRFLTLIQKRSSVLFRVGNLLLLLLRISLLVLVVLLFAQPFFLDPALRHWNSGPRALIVLWDNSASMAARNPEGGSLQDELRERLGTLLSPVDPRDQLHVLALSPRAHSVYSGPLEEFQLDQLPAATGAGADWDGAIAEAHQILHREAASDRLLVLASDFQAADWDAARASSLPLAGLVRLRPSSRPGFNAGIVQVEEVGATAVAGQPWSVRVEVSRGRLFPPGANLRLQLVELGEGREEILGEQEVPTESRSSHRFEVAFDQLREVRLELRLRGVEDALDFDDRVPLRLEVRGPRRILCWNGDPRPARLYDEVFYLEKAARAAGLEVEQVQGAADLEARDPERYVAFHLANVPDPNGVDPFVEEMLEAGGALVVWAGDKTEPTAWHQGFLRERAGLELFGRATLAHPAPWSYAQPPQLPAALEGLGASKFWTGIASRGYWFLREHEGGGRARVLALHKDGTPAVLVLRAGNGLVVWVNSGADLEDSDLPMHPVFPALLRRTSLFGEGPLPTHLVGEPVFFPVRHQRQAEQMVVLTPSGHQVPLRPELQGERLEAIFRDSRELGVHRLVEGTGAQAVTRWFQVRGDPEESLLAPLDEARLETLLPATDSEGGLPRARTRGPRLREVLLLLLCLVLLGESWLVGYLESRGEPRRGP